MAFVGGEREVTLGGYFFQSGESYDLGENRGVEQRGIGFPRKEGGGQVMSDAFGKNEEVGAEAVEGGFESASN